MEIVGEENSTDDLEELVLSSYDTSVNISQHNDAAGIPMVWLDLCTGGNILK